MRKEVEICSKEKQTLQKTCAEYSKRLQEKEKVETESKTIIENLQARIDTLIANLKAMGGAVEVSGIFFIVINMVSLLMIYIINRLHYVVTK